MGAFSCLLIQTGLSTPKCNVQGLSAGGATVSPADPSTTAMQADFAQNDAAQAVHHVKRMLNECAG